MNAINPLALAGPTKEQLTLKNVIFSWHRDYGIRPGDYHYRQNFDLYEGEEVHHSYSIKIGGVLKLGSFPPRVTTPDTPAEQSIHK